MKYYLIKSLINETVDYYILYVTKVTRLGIHYIGFQTIFNYNIENFINQKNFIKNKEMIIYYISDDLKGCENYLKIVRYSKKYNI